MNKLSKEYTRLWQSLESHRREFNQVQNERQNTSRCVTSSTKTVSFYFECYIFIIMYNRLQNERPRIINFRRESKQTEPTVFANPTDRKHTRTWENFEERRLKVVEILTTCSESILSILPHSESIFHTRNTLFDKNSNRIYQHGCSLSLSYLYLSLYICPSPIVYKYSYRVHTQPKGVSSKRKRCDTFRIILHVHMQYTECFIHDRWCTRLQNKIQNPFDGERVWDFQSSYTRKSNKTHAKFSKLHAFNVYTYKLLD